MPTVGIIVLIILELSKTLVPLLKSNFPAFEDFFSESKADCALYGCFCDCKAKVKVFTIAV